MSHTPPRKTKAAAWIVAVWLAVPATGVPARQEPDTVPGVQQAEPEVVSVLARPVRLAAITESATVLTREQIEASGAADLGHLLRGVPGVSVSGAAGRTTVFLRGGDPNLTLVLLDGVPLNDPTGVLGGAVDLSAISLDDVERVEILRGPMSARFGSEALAGAIHVLTRRPAGVRTAWGSVHGGTSSTHRLAARAEHALGAMALSLSVRDEGTESRVAGDARQRRAVVASAGLPMGGAADLRITARGQRATARAFPDASGGPEHALAPIPRAERSDESSIAVRLLHQRRDGAEHALELDHLDRRVGFDVPAVLDAVPPGPSAQPSFSGRTQFRRTRASWSARRSTARVDGAVQVGVEQQRGIRRGLLASAVPTDFALRREIGCAIADLRATRGRWAATAGVRADVTDGLSPAVSPRMGISRSVGASGARWRASWGKGFKLPSFFALGDPTVGTPELRPERGRGWDVGVEAGGARSWSLIAHGAAYTDLIDFDPATLRLVNRSGARVRGVEGRLGASVGRGFTVELHAGRVSARLVGSDEPLRERPRWSGGGAVAWSVPGRLVRLQLDAVGPRFDFQLPVPERRVVGGFATVSLFARRDLRGPLRLTLRVENLLDRRYHELVGFPGPGREVVLGLERRFA